MSLLFNYANTFAMSKPLFEDELFKIRTQIPIRIGGFYHFNPIFTEDEKEIICYGIPENYGGALDNTFMFASNFTEECPFYLNYICLETGNITRSYYLGMHYYKDFCISESKKYIAIITRDEGGYESVHLYSLPNFELAQVISNPRINEEKKYIDLNLSNSISDYGAKKYDIRSIVQISPDDNYLVFSSMDYEYLQKSTSFSEGDGYENCIVVWDINKKEEKMFVNLSDSFRNQQVFKFHFSPDSKSVLCAYYHNFSNFISNQDGGNILVLDIENSKSYQLYGEDRPYFSYKLRQNSIYPEYKVKFNPKNNTFCLSYDKTHVLYIYSIANGELLHELYSDNWISDFYFIENYDKLVLACYNDYILLFDTDDYKLIKMIYNNYYINDCFLLTIGDEQILLVSPVINYDEKGKLISPNNEYNLINIKTGELISTLNFEKYIIPSLLTHSDSGRLLLGNNELNNYKQEFIIYDLSGIFKYYNVPKYRYEAEVLKSLGVFAGTGKGLDLDKVPTRMQGLIMMIRLLGKEAEAEALKNEESIFTDVPKWAVGYANYAFKSGLTKGIGNDLFGTDLELNANDFMTFMLRALGYDDSKGDFNYSHSINFANQIGMLTRWDVSELTHEAFLRDHIAKISMITLKTKIKNEDIVLINKLINDGIIVLN